MHATTQRIIIATVLFGAGFISTGRSQELSPQGCLNLARAVDPEGGSRTRVTWVKDATGELKPVLSRIKTVRFARLIFVGQPAMPSTLQEQIAKSLSARNYGEDGIEELKERIEDAWQQQGYFLAKVDLSGSQVLDETEETKTVALTIRVDAGKQYRLDEIDFTVLNPARRSPSSLASAEERGQFSAEELRAFFPIEQGDVFDTHKIQQGLEQMRKAYGKKGFLNVVPVPTTQTDEKTGRIRLAVEIDEGKQFRIGSITVLGLDPSTSKQLLPNHGLLSGSIFDVTRPGKFYRDSGTALPDGYSAEDYFELRLDEEKATVDLILRAPCPGL